MDEKRLSARKIRGLIAFGVVLFVGLWHLGSVAQALALVLDILSFLLVGAGLAFIINVPMRKIESLFARLPAKGLRRPLALGITLLLLLALVVFTMVMVVPEFVRTVARLTSELPAFLRTAEAWINGMAATVGVSEQVVDVDVSRWQELMQAAIDLLKNGLGSVLRGTFSAATGIVSGVTGLVIGVILALYILAGKERLADQATRVLRAYLPPARVERTLSIARLANRTFSAFVGGQCLEAVILGLLSFVGMTVLRFPFAAMVSVLIGVTAVIPIFGAFIGWGVGAFMILVEGGLAQAGWFTLFFLVLQQIEGNLIYPHVVGKSIMLPGLWVLIAATLGGNLAGIPGMLICVPLCSVLYALLRDAVNRRNAARAGESTGIREKD